MIRGRGCPRCGYYEDVILNGSYFRKNPGIYIQRMKCKRCGVTFSWLPPFLLKNKRYTVNELQHGIETYINSSYGYASIKLPLPADSPFSSGTLMNWVDYFSKEAGKFFQTARSILAERRPRSRFDKDKRLLKYSFPQAHSKAKTNGLGYLYQLFILREYFAFIVEPEDFLTWLIFVSRLALPSRDSRAGLGRNKKFKTTRFNIGNSGQIGNNSS